jgi:hypothetical protein
LGLGSGPNSKYKNPAGPLFIVCAFIKDDLSSLEVYFSRSSDRQCDRPSLESPEPRYVACQEQIDGQVNVVSLVFTYVPVPAQIKLPHRSISNQSTADPFPSPFTELILEDLILACMTALRRTGLSSCIQSPRSRLEEFWGLVGAITRLFSGMTTCIPNYNHWIDCQQENWRDVQVWRFLVRK